jgi:hypothetical protein
MRRKTKLPWREFPKRETMEHLAALPALPPDEMLPDLGAYVIAQDMPTPCRFPLCEVWVITPTGDRQTDLVFITQLQQRRYLGTVIVAEAIEIVQAALTSQYISVKGVPRPDEQYTTPVGETVIPFRGAFEVIPEEQLLTLSMN